MATATLGKPVVSGSSVTVSGVFSASKPVTASVGVCARDAREVNVDFPLMAKVRLGATGTRVDRTRTFRAGTYTYWPCASMGGAWHALSARGTFTVGAVAVPPAEGPTAASTMPAQEVLPPSEGAPHGWRRVLAEDFSKEVASPYFAAAYPELAAYPDSWRNSVGSSSYNGGKSMSVAGGVARQRVATDAAGVPRTETLVPSKAQNMSYGRFALRWRVPRSLPGYKIAWLLWPESETWPRDGEIDFPEGGLEPGAGIEGYMHRQGATTGSDQDSVATAVPLVSDEWHTTEIVWAPDLCQFLLDGRLISTSRTRVPNTPMGWRIQTEGNLAGTPISSSVAGDIEIDWLTAYTRTPPS